MQKSGNKKKLKQQNSQVWPGPGAYNLDQKWTAPQFSIGKGNRSASKTFQIPGPGQYSYNLRNYRGTRFTHSVRFCYKPPQTPGPGSYNLALQPNSPSFSMQTRQSKTIWNYLPGPTQYNPDQSLKRSRCTVIYKNKAPIKQEKPVLGIIKGWKTIQEKPIWQFKFFPSKTRAKTPLIQKLKFLHPNLIKHIKFVFIFEVVCNLMDLNGILFPSPRSSYSSDTFPGQMIWIPRISNSPLPAIPCLFLSCPRGSSKILLYFHGNAQDVGLAYQLMDHLRSTLMMHVLAIQYPGYGIYNGKPSAQQVILDSENVFLYLTNSLNINPRNIIIFGRSIGSGPSTYLAAKHQPGVLILMSAYTSIKDTVKHIVGSFLAIFVKDRFRNIDLMPEVSCPTFLIHGQKDTLIPYTESQKLHQACNGPCSLILPREMDHNEFDFFDDLSLPFSAFLMQCGISVFPDSMHTAFLSIPPSLFTHPDTQENRNRGVWNSVLKKFN